MTRPLVLKLLRDVRLSLAVIVVLLVGFQCMWAKITERITAQLLPLLLWMAAGRNVTQEQVEQTIFAGPGKISRALMGGESISLFRVTDMLTIGYVHPLVQVILCIWAIGRASGAIAGEIDRGTMELLMSQPLARFRLLLAHFAVDLVTIPLLCFSLWAGNWLGIWLVGVKEVAGSVDSVAPHVNALIFGPALWNVGAMVFAMSGYTLWLSSMGRYRVRVLGAAVLITLVQFLINVVGQLWEAVAPLRPFTVFYYYQPQQIILRQRWSVAVSLPWASAESVGTVNVVVVLLLVGLAGYGLALWHFTRRDLPAPL